MALATALTLLNAMQLGDVQSGFCDTTYIHYIGRCARHRLWLTDVVVYPNTIILVPCTYTHEQRQGAQAYDRT
jgi:hypothetical protein